MMDNAEIEQKWLKVKEKLQKKYDANTFDEHFAPIIDVYKYQNGYIFLIVLNEFAKYRLIKFYQKEMNALLAEECEEKCLFSFITTEEVEKEKVANEVVSINQPNPQEKVITERILRPEYTFDNYVTGEANREAFTFSVKVSQSPNVTVNPLYIFGDVGLGKTHLMMAIGHAILQNNINTNVVYTTAQQFAEDFFASKNKNQKNTEVSERFDHYYRSADLLLVDDIQFLTGKPGTQDEFFKLFEILFEKNKQIVITSDRPASELDIMPRLKSRFAWGIPVDVRKPNFELRKSILKRKVLTLLSDPSVVEERVYDYIANSFPENVRELEGGLRRFWAYCVSFNCPFTLDNAIIALESIAKKDNNTTDEKSSALVDRIKEVTVKYFNITIKDLMSDSRKQEYVYARHIIIYILRNRYNFFLKKIGFYLGGKDHATVAHACNRIEDMIKDDSSTKQDIDNILKKIEQKSE